MMQTEHGTELDIGAFFGCDVLILASDESILVCRRISY